MPMSSALDSLSTNTYLILVKTLLGKIPIQRFGVILDVGLANGAEELNNVRIVAPLIP